MKNIKIGLIAGAMALSIFTSCKKLDLFPYSNIATSQSFETIRDAKAWNVGLYSAFRGRVNGGYMFPQDVFGDQLNASLDFGNRNGAPHRWEIFPADGVFSGPWNGLYGAIANINTAIVGFEGIPTASAAEAADLARYKGDNYLARAFYYHQLVLRFAKPYNPTTAATDLAVPIITKFDVTALPARNTVKQVYDQILADINAARPLLASTAGVKGSNKFTIDILTALEARVKLSMQDWAGAYTAANSLITGGKYSLTTTAAAFKDLWHVDGNQEAIMQMSANNSTEVTVTNGGSYLGLITATKRWQPDFIPSQWVIDMYSDNDNRKATYFEKKDLTIQGLNYNGIWLVNKYPGNPALFTAANTNYAHAFKVFNIGEMYLIAAEAAFRQPNEGNALTALNALRTARGLATVSSTGAALLQDIKDERFRELAFEGTRLWDLKRWGDGFTRHDPQNVNIINVGPTYTGLTIAPNNPKFQWALPSADISVNPNLVQNPGW